MLEEFGNIGSFSIGGEDLLPDAEIMRTGRVPLDVYYSAERFEQEKHVFGQVWLNIAEAAEIPNAGDWVVREVKIRSVSAIIVRGKDMKIRAFHNICAHRGMKLVWDDKGRGGKFSCPYHAWGYNAEGQLTNLPDEACFPHVDKNESGLTPIACDVWEGLIFINLSPEPKQSLVEFLGPVSSRLKNIPFGSYPYAARIGALIETNWKLAVEAQSESYHARSLHSRTVAKMLCSKENPYIHPLEWQALGAHRMQSVPRNGEFEFPVERLVQTFSFINATQMVIADTGIQKNTGPSFIGHPDINPAQHNLWSNDQYSIYPHFIFHVSLGGWFLHRFWPLAPDRTYWEAVYHFERPQSLRNQFAIQYSLALNRDTLMEDNLALIQQQEIMQSGAKKYLQFGEQEALCRHLAAVSEAVANSIGGEVPVAAE